MLRPLLLKCGIWRELDSCHLERQHFFILNYSITGCCLAELAKQKPSIESTEQQPAIESAEQQPTIESAEQQPAIESAEQQPV